MADVIEDLYKNLQQLRQQVRDNNVKIMFLQSQKKSNDVLVKVSKLRELIDILELLGKPKNMSEVQWFFEMSRAERWKTLHMNPAAHHLIAKFLEHFDQEIDETIHILLCVCNKKLENIFNNRKVDEFLLDSGLLKKIVDVLNSLEKEIMLAFKSLN